MNVQKGYEPRFTPEGYLFWSHVDKNDRQYVAEQVKVPESAVLILPYDTELGGKGGKSFSNFSAFINKTHESALNVWNKEFEILEKASNSFLKEMEKDLFGGFHNWYNPFVIPLNTTPLTGVFSLDIETVTPKESAKNMTNGEKVFVNMADGSRLHGMFITEFWNPKKAEYFATVLLDAPNTLYTVDGIRVNSDFVSVRSASVVKWEADGVKLTPTYIHWTNNGETREFAVNANQARAFAAMAHVDKITAIKSFRAHFLGCELKASKDVIERLMAEFPAR